MPSFKKNHSFERRKREASLTLQHQPDHIPVSLSLTSYSLAAPNLTYIHATCYSTTSRDTTNYLPCFHDTRNIMMKLTSL